MLLVLCLGALLIGGRLVRSIRLGARFTGFRTFKVVERLLAELAVIFPDTTFHLGGDEVHFQCWNNSARVVAFMHAEGMVNRSTGALDFPQLEQYYAERLLAIAARVMYVSTAFWTISRGFCAIYLLNLGRILVIVGEIVWGTIFRWCLPRF